MTWDSSAENRAKDEAWARARVEEAAREGVAFRASVVRDLLLSLDEVRARLDEAEKALRGIVALDSEGFSSAHSYEQRVLSIAREAPRRIEGEK